MKRRTIYVNTRNLFNETTGVQRYTSELLNRLSDKLQPIRPNEPLSGLAGHLWEQVTLPYIMGKYSVLWSPANTGPLAVTRQVVTIHDMSVFDFPEGFNAGFSAWYRFLLPRLASGVHKIIAVSEFTREKILEHCNVDASKISVIYNGVDERFRPASKDKIEDTRRRLNIPSPYYLIALGTLEPRKNIRRLLQAWASIRGQLPDDVWLVLAGLKGNALIFPELPLDDLPPRVYLTGQVSDVDLPALYSGAIATLYPSLYEGFGLPPLESMACGTPVIVSNTASLPEIIGNAGIYFDPLEVESIAETITKFVHDSELHFSLQQKGLERAVFFTWENTAALTWQVLQEAAERNES